MAARETNDLRVVQCRTIRREQRKTLVDNVVSRAELPHVIIPAMYGITSILHDGRPHAGILVQALKLLEAHVADAEQARLAATVDRFHRTPGFPVVRR